MSVEIVRHRKFGTIVMTPSISVVCRTNMDLHSEEWPKALPAIPAVGTEIESKTIHTTARGQFQLKLQVIRVTYRVKRANAIYSAGLSEWYPEIELGLTSFQQMLPASKGAAGSLLAFYEWYAPLVGSSVSAFI